MKFFKNKNRDLVDFLKIENVNLNSKLQKEKAINDDLSNVMLNMTNTIKELKKSLKSTSNGLIEANKTNSDLKSEIILLKKEILKKDELLELKEKQRRKSAGKVGDLTKKIAKIKIEKEGQNEIIKNLNHDNVKLKALVKTNKNAKEYLKGKSERE